MNNRTLLGYILIWSVVFSLFVTSAYVAALVWPYNYIRVDYPDGDVFQIEADTDRIVDGMPVVERSLALKDLDICNDGFDVEAEKWLDSFGKYTPNSKIVVDDNIRTGSVLIQKQIFYVDTSICTKNYVEVRIPGHINSGLIYEMRIQYRYKPNFAKTETVEIVSEPFVYEDGGRGR